MPNARWIEVAQAIADEINAQEWSEDFDADRNYADFAIHNTTDRPTNLSPGVLRCDVVPFNGPETDMDASGLVRFRCPTDVCFRYLFKTDELTTEGRVNKDRLDALSLLFQDVLLHFHELSLDTIDANWVSTDILQTHAPGTLLENKQWTGMFRVVYDAPKAK